ncbi:MAG: 23S rRNA (adenine(2503)-C(2))-methyltransferase RlmN [bacterium]
MSGERLPDIRSLSREEIGLFLSGHNEKPFRSGQVYDWLWKRSCGSFDEMTNLPASLRHLLKEHFTFYKATAEHRQESSDGAVKIGFRLFDDSMVEGVLIPSGERATACISSQAGCALGCKFCATGKLGFTRNLTAGEIFDQVTMLASLQHKLSNIVYMGMGEPFLNYEAVVESVEKITSPEGLGMSPQRITISSIGIPKMIRRMADDNPKFHFALSLHAAADEKRNMIIPFNLKHPLAEISDALKYYHTVTGKRFTIEYILFGNFNDSLADAKSLALFCRNFPVKINLIEYNPVKDTGYTIPDPGKTQMFMAFLESKNMVVNLRKSRGKEIDAACGQLAAKQLRMNN